MPLFIRYRLFFSVSIRAVPASALATVAPLQQKVFCEYEQAVFGIVINALPEGLWLWHGKALFKDNLER